MKDQYGQKVPADLVVLHFGFDPETPVIHGDPLEPEDIKIAMAARWFEVEGRGLILASYDEIGGNSFSAPIDCGIDLRAPGLKINRIADQLKRYSWEDGFYHA